jgi:glutathione S-transferase
MSHAVVLHQWEISPFCQKVANALKHKGIAFDTVNYNGILGVKVQRLSKVGKLPVIDINGQRIQDSTKIARYLDEAYPNTPLLYSKNPQINAQIELWEDWSDEALYWFEVYFRVNDSAALEQAVVVSTLGRPIYETFILQPLLKAALKTQVMMQGLGRMTKKDVEAEFLHHLDRIELTLNTTGFLVGTSKTIADIAVATQLSEIVRTSASMRPQILNRPAVAAWLNR